MKTTLAILASLRLTLVGMVLLAVLALASYTSASLPSFWLVLPLALLALNLAAAILSNPRFRRQGGLLVFHLCLLVIVMLAGIGLMTRLDGRVEITEGQAFDPATVEIISRGPWHPWRMDRVAFTQSRIRVDYAPALIRRQTRSEVLTPDATGRLRAITFGDNHALTAAGYRFVSTSNKGLVAIITWLDDSGRSVTGAVHLPSYPLLEWKQSNEWVTPRGQAVQIELELPERPPQDQAWTLTSHNLRARIVVKTVEHEPMLDVGQSVNLNGGALRFDEVRLWMGYRIDYNPTLPWLFAAALIGIIALAWHFWQKLGRHSLAAPIGEPRMDTNYADMARN
jgi:cytochrome c biogenesis protein